MNSRQFLLVILLPCLWPLVAGTVKAQAPGAESTTPPLVFDGSAVTLSRSLKLRRGHFTGQRGTLVIDGGPDRRCHLEIPAGCVIQDLKLHVRQGSELTISQSLLRDCQIYAEPRTIITITDSGLEQCELNGYGESGKGFPAMKLVNCVLGEPGFLRPVNALGLDMQDCIILDAISILKSPKAEVLEGAPFAEQARSPRIRYTTFRKCHLNPTLFYTVSHCTFSGCITSGISVENAAASAAGNIVLPIRWIDCTPQTVPTLGGGVVLQALTTTLSGGCKLKYTWEKPTLSMDGVTLAATAAPLASVLPADIEPAVTATLPMPDQNLPSPSSGPDIQVKLKLTQVNGLLVMPLPSGKMAGQASRMNLTTLPGVANLRFNQTVGEQMLKALREVEKFMILRHQALPAHSEMEISFEEKYSGKDGPSAAVPCALLVESAITGKAWDPAFAVTGDLNADGAVQPIGGVAAKVRGATNSSCSIIAVPAKNETSVADVLVMDGPGPLVGITIFSISKFDDAVALADPERKPLLQQALTEMATVRAVLMRDPRSIPMILKTPQAAARLLAILEKAPTCLSAKYLLLYAQGRAPSTLTIGGSIEATDNSGAALVTALNNTFAEKANSLQPDELGGSLNRLRNLRPKIDKRVWPYLDAMVNYGDLVRSGLMNPSMRAGARAAEFVQKLNQTASSVSSAKEGLLADPRVREELDL